MKVTIFIANGSEDAEYVLTRDLLVRAGIEVSSLSINEKRVELSHGLVVIADGLIDDFKDTDAIILPGGVRGVNNFLECEKLLDIIRKYNDNKKLLCAICAAPIVLGKAGVLLNRQYTCYDGFNERNDNGTYVKAKTIRSENIITGRSLNYTFEFALNIIDYLLGNTGVEKVKKGILREE